jgi:hypothetical protein
LSVSLSRAKVFDEGAAERIRTMTVSSKISPIANIIPGIIPFIIVWLIR